MKKISLILCCFAILSSALMLSSCKSEDDGWNSGTAPTVQGTEAVKKPFGDFTSSYINGDPVDNSIFSGHKLTMVNVWGTFCSPCIREMPELGEISKEYEDKDFQIVGIVIDAVDEKGNSIEKIIKSANDIIDETGADYLHILPSSSLYDVRLGEVEGYPTTYFVDGNGDLVGKTYLGMKTKKDWKAIIDKLL